MSSVSALFIRDVAGILAHGWHKEMPTFGDLGGGGSPLPETLVRHLRSCTDVPAELGAFQPTTRIVGAPNDFLEDLYLFPRGKI